LQNISETAVKNISENVARIEGQFVTVPIQHFSEPFATRIPPVIGYS
jgi:hypothetical protein